MNCCMGCGRLGGSIELKYTPRGHAVCRAAGAREQGGMTRMHLVQSGLVAALVVLVAVQVVPFVLADGETNRSMWQARLIRWRWRRLARMLGLYISDPTQTVTQVFVGERGQWASPPRPRILIPRIRVRADEDGKGGADYEDLTERFFAWSGDDLHAANAIFRRLQELRRQRSERIRSVLGVKNLWHVGPSRCCPLVLLVIDEAHTFLADV